MNLSVLFDEVARARPKDPAIVSTRGRCTFGELRARIADVAGALRRRGVGSEEPVAVCMPRSIESMIAVLGILRAGAAYVPIDPNYPVERQRFMVADSGVRTVIVSRSHGAPPAWIERDSILDLSDMPTGHPPPPLDQLGTDDLLFLLYTSGSTGRPKGVLGTHSMVLNRLRWGWSLSPFRPGEVVGHRTSLNFVDSVVEMFSGLLQGVPTAVVLPDEHADLGRFVGVLRDHAVTRLYVVPTIMAALVRSASNFGADLALVTEWMSSGEQLPVPLLRRFREAHPNATVLNLYGSTEIMDVTCSVFAPTTAIPVERVAIGRAVANAELVVLDADGEPCRDGDTGELFIAGPVLARGYHRRPLEEAARFVRHPLRPTERAFRTGDLVRRMPDGELHYLGRADNVVKIRGVRVELEEIDRVLLAACPGIEQVAAVTVEEPGSNLGPQLFAFVTPRDADISAIRGRALAQLPSVMVPHRIIALDAFPLLPNGKFDRRALTAMLVPRREISADRQPATPTEKRLASLWTAILGPRPIARDDTFARLGGDSLALTELSAAIEREPGFTPVDSALLRDGTLENVARALERAPQPASKPEQPELRPRISIAPLVASREILSLLVEASRDATICAATLLPAHLDVERARRYCEESDGVVILVDGQPAGVAVAEVDPDVGLGVDVPRGAVQLDEWLLERYRGQGILDADGAWPLLAAWLARRFDHEVAVIWEDNTAMLGIVRARGYRKVGTSHWQSDAAGDGSSGRCEVWLCDLAPYRNP